MKDIEAKNPIDHSKDVQGKNKRNKAKRKREIRAVVLTLIVTLTAIGAMTFFTYGQGEDDKSMSLYNKNTFQGKRAGKEDSKNQTRKSNDENVYLITDPEGNIKETIVSDGGVLKYTGYEESKPPVALKVTYTLDGSEIKESDLKGKSGRLSINLTYDNQETYNGVKVPFLVVSGMVLDNKHFSNVSVDNGKAVDDGDRTLAVAYTLPGMKENLGDNSYDIPLPNSVTISADVKDFKMSTIYSLVSNDIFKDMKANKKLNLDDVEASVNKLKSGSQQLMAGTGKLKEGTAKLQPGVQTLLEGTKQLQGGVVQLQSGAESLNEGNQQLANGLQSLSQESQKLRDGGNQMVVATIGAVDKSMDPLREKLSHIPNTPKIPALTVENYSQVIDQAIAILSQLGPEGQQAAKALEGGKESIDQAIMFNMGIEAYTQGVDKASGGAATIASKGGALVEGVAGLNQGMEAIIQGEGKLSEGVNQLAAGADALDQGVNEMSKETLEKLKSLNPTQLKTVAQALEKLGPAAKSYNGFGSKGAYDSVRFIIKTDEI